MRAGGGVDATRAVGCGSLFDTFETRVGQRAMEYCPANDGASVFVHLYQVVHQNVPEPEARADMERFWTLTPVYQALIEEVLRAHLSS